METIKELRKELDEGVRSEEELFSSCVRLAREYQDDYNCFVTIMDFDKEENDNSNSLINLRRGY